MAVLLLGVILPLLLVEDDDLVAPDLPDDGRLDRSAAHRGGSDAGLVSAHHQDLTEGDLLAIHPGEHVALDPDRGALLDSILFSACADDCVHVHPPENRSLAL